ncbi:hypothetical protein ACTRXD_07800 [Nitrospira sp. T9]|uniref:hypothetical protein n=1 Tax=unclassified Nitrospira TaxID=2652172 RepID=UPI003F9B45F4
MGNFISSLLKGIGFFLGVVLLILGGWVGLENWQAPGNINLPITAFSVVAILVGSIFLWLALKKRQKE